MSNLRFISMKKLMLSWVEHEKSFITSGPERSLLSMVIAFGTYLVISTFAKTKLGSVSNAIDM